MVSPAGGWVRPACAAIEATWWSIASIRHDGDGTRDRGTAPPLSLDGDVDLLPRHRHLGDLQAGERRLGWPLDFGKPKHRAAARRQLAAGPSAVRADPSLS